jgi:ribonuclease R
MSDNSSAGSQVVVELRTRGKLVVGDPYFTPGIPIVIDRHGLRDTGPGDLAVVRTGRGRARVERVLGSANHIDAVLEGLLHERGEHGAHETVPEPPPPSLEGRTDLRDLPTITIDPETAKDFDDAISIVREGDGLRAYVHIADVSHFVAAGSPLDVGAADRSCSVYVPGRVARMLPAELADDLCSLRPHLDRLTLTVEIPFGPGLEMGTPVFYRSVIRSDLRLTYGLAEAALAGREKLPQEVGEPLRHAERVAEELRRRRFARGALRVEAPEVTFAFDGEGGISDAWLESEPHAHMLVEELMILANEAVAGLLGGRRREALYRVHDPPEPQSIARLVAALADLGVPTPSTPETERMTPAQAAALAGEVSERLMDYVRRSGRGAAAFPPLVLRSLKQARYDPSNLGHSGLASPAYCHFTSPIRRYPDVVCHRALLKELGISEEPPAYDLEQQGEHASTREREATDIEYAADAICLAWLLERRLFERGWEHAFEGEITGAIPSGIFVRFDSVFEGYVPARSLGGDYYELNALGTALEGRRSGRSYRLGDPLAVRVEKIERADGKVELRDMKAR